MTTSTETVTTETAAATEIVERTDLTKVTVEEVLTLCRELGCVVGELNTYWAVEAPLYNKKTLYVGKAKRRMTRLDVAGFVPKESHVAIEILSSQDAKDLKLGAVRGQILPKTIREESTDVLEAVKLLVEQLLDEELGFKLGKRTIKEVELIAIETGDEKEIDTSLTEDDIENLNDLGDTMNSFKEETVETQASA